MAFPDQIPASKEPQKADCPSAPCSASSESLWKPIGELGEIAYMEDGSHRWKLWAGYEETRLFLVYLACGDIETHFASIDDGGMLCNEHGDDVGWAWYDAEYFLDIPQRSSPPNH
jgi:hypothetical protein